MRGRVDLSGGEVEDAAAADRGELVPVTEQREPRTWHSSATVSRARAVSWSSMPGLVDDQQIAGPQPRPSAGPA